MAWIESNQGIKDHPKTLLLASRMGWDVYTTIGRLHSFWWWCLEYAPTGDLRKFDEAILAQSVGLAPSEGAHFLNAMVEAKWIDKNKKVFRVHDWVEYAGRYLRDTKFKHKPEKWKETLNLYSIECQPKVSRQILKSADKSALPTRPTNLTNQTDQPDHAHTREEGDDGFEKFWDVYPKKKSRGQAKKAWLKIKPSEQLLATIIATIERAKTSEDWLKEKGKYIPHPATWLNAEGWHDEYTPANTKLVMGSEKTASNWEMLERRMKEGIYDEN